MIKKLYLLLVLIVLITSCNSPKLNGHYHVEWGNSNSFQTWNIKNNRMKINEPVCSDEKLICYGMPIKFKGDSIFIPWVDIIFEAAYYTDKNGVIYLKDNSNSSLKLVPKENCISSKDYFRNKKFTELKDFKLYKTYIMSGNSVFPIKRQNELIISKSKGKPFYIFNDNKISFNKRNNSFNIKKSSVDNKLWIHIDERVKLKEVTFILKEVYEKGYKIYFSQKEDIENDEQVVVFKKSILNIEKKKNSYHINSCEYCEKHPTKKIDSILKFKIFGLDSCLVKNKVTDFFQLRNHTVRFLKQNRITRLNTQIRLEINSNILFKEYLELITEIDFVNTSLLGTTYRDSSDIDYKYISNKQFSYNRDSLEFEFPLRIQEVIKPF
jgi:hypothetical protein